MGVATGVPGQRLRGGGFGARDRITHPRVRDVLMFAMKYPTSPALSRFTGTFSGFMMPISSTPYVAPVFINLIWSPTLDRAVDDAEDDHDAAIRVEVRVED